MVKTLFVLLLSTVLMIGCLQVPSERDFQPEVVRERCEELWELRSYSALSDYAAQVKVDWLSFPERDYYTTVVMAHAFFHLGAFKESLPFYEAALLLYPKPETLWLYTRAVEKSAFFKRGWETFNRLGRIYPEQENLIQGLKGIMDFHGDILAADALYFLN